MLRRTMNAARLNELANHPEIRPFMSPSEGPLDVSALALDPRTVLLEAEHGTFLMQPILPATYEGHAMFLPEGRGPPMLEAARAMFRFMFTQTDCLEILTKCPDDNDPAKNASAYLGFHERFRREDAWRPGVGISYRVLSVDDWFLQDPECQAEGQAFHTLLEESKRAIGSQLPVHPEDLAHDRAVGAAILMAKAGQIEKGVGLYNRWAIFAGYETIAVIAPNVVDVRDAIVGVRNGQMEVLLCRWGLDSESRPLPASAEP